MKRSYKLSQDKSNNHQRLFDRCISILPILIPKMPLNFDALTFSISLSTPSLLKPIRLIIALASGIRNKRGFGLPDCGRGVIVPISMKPKPNPANASI